MITLYIAAGHSPTSKGANWHGRGEETEAIKAVDKAVAVAKPHVKGIVDLVIVPHNLDYAQATSWLKKRMTDADNNICIEVHFNAFHDQSATGTETLHKSNAGFAKRVNDALVRNLKLRNRGVKRRTDLYLLNSFPTSAVLAEMCFISNKEDMKRFDRAGVKALASAIVSVAKGKNVDVSVPRDTVPEEPKPEPKPPVEEPVEPHPIPPAQPDDNKLLELAHRLDKVEKNQNVIRSFFAKFFGWLGQALKDWSK